MSKQFYTDIIDIEEVIVELNDMDLNDHEKMQLAKLFDSTLHHTILDAVLSELPEDEKHVFLRHLNDGNHDKIWEHLNNKVDKIEDKIKKTAEDFKKEMHEDIKEAKLKK